MLRRLRHLLHCLRLGVRLLFLTSLTAYISFDDLSVHKQKRKEKKNHSSANPKTMISRSPAECCSVGLGLGLMTPARYSIEEREAQAQQSLSEGTSRIFFSPTPYFLSLLPRLGVSVRVTDKPSFTHPALSSLIQLLF